MNSITLQQLVSIKLHYSVRGAGALNVELPLTDAFVTSFTLDGNN